MGLVTSYFNYSVTSQPIFKKNINMTKEKKQCIVCDLHGVLLNKDNEINRNIANLLKSLSAKYSILFYTASNSISENQVKKSNVMFAGLFHMAGNDSDTHKKNILLKRISEDYVIEFVIDNNKKVCKELKKDYNFLRLMI